MAGIRAPRSLRTSTSNTYYFLGQKVLIKVQMIEKRNIYCIDIWFQSSKSIWRNKVAKPIVQKLSTVNFTFRISFWAKNPASIKTVKMDRERKTGHSSDFWMVLQCPKKNLNSNFEVTLKLEWFKYADSPHHANIQHQKHLENCVLL